MKLFGSKTDPELMARCLMPAMADMIKQLDKIKKGTGLRYTYKDGKHILTDHKKEWEIK